VTKRWKVQRRDWVLHPPFNSWQRGVVDMITYMVEEGNEPAKAVWEALRTCPPEGGWTDDARQFVKLAFKFASKNRPHRGTSA
jgi:hypothetical protein